MRVSRPPSEHEPLPALARTSRPKSSEASNSRLRRFSRHTLAFGLSGWRVMGLRSVRAAGLWPQHCSY